MIFVYIFVYSVCLHAYLCRALMVRTHCLRKCACFYWPQSMLWWCAHTAPGDDGLCLPDPGVQRAALPHHMPYTTAPLYSCTAKKRQIYSICIETQVQHHTNAIKTEQAGQLKITIALICLRKSFLHTNNNPEVFYPDGGAYENFYGRTNTVKKRKVRHHLEKERQSDGIYSQNCEQLMDFDLICHLQGSLGHERPHRKRATQQTTVVNN